MKERPILFQGAMVRALLAGTKTQTRRVCKFEVRAGMPEPEWQSLLKLCPYGQPGDRLWVREAWAVGHGYDGMPPRAIPDLPFVKRHYAAAEDRGGLLWRPSIHMPRWASRITLEVSGVRVERLQDISEADAIAEGCEALPFPGPWWQGYKADEDGELHHQQTVGETPPDWMIEPKRMKMAQLDRSARDAYRQLWMQINGVDSWEANPWVWVVEFRRLP